MPAKRTVPKPKSRKDFGQARKQERMLRAGVYARVSTLDQQTLPLQMRALRECVLKRGWTVVEECKEVGPGAAARAIRRRLIDSARRRDIDVVLVWRLDGWGRSVADLVSTLQELTALGVGFVSMTEALNLTTPEGRAMAGLLAVFAAFERDVLSQRVRAGLEHARRQGKRQGRPPLAPQIAADVRRLARPSISESEIARQLRVDRTSVRRILARKER
mgnify:CR=1 FL=1